MTLSKILLKSGERVWVPIDLWEEIPANMWGKVGDHAEMLQRAIEFTGDATLYGSFMQRVVVEWPNSCTNALTDANLNQRAWVGHAACALALGCPEYITRKAWGYLTHEQRVLANIEATRAIQCWKMRNIEGERIRLDMEKKMLFE